MIQNTTLKSFAENIKPQLGQLQFEIRQLLRTYQDGLTNKEIGAILKKDASTISGIVRPLVKPKDPRQAPTVYEAGERPCGITGHKVKVWRLTSLRDQPPAPKVAEAEHKPISLFG